MDAAAVRFSTASHENTAILIGDQLEAEVSPLSQAREPENSDSTIYR